MTVSGDLARWIVGFERSQAPDGVAEATAKALINSIATGIGGFPIDSVGRALAYASTLSNTGPSRVMVSGTRLAPGAAAFVNGVMLNALGQEETHLPTGSHPAETTVPLVLALAEAGRVTGRQAIDALIVGMQVTMAIASMELTPPVKYEICQAPSVFGTIGAAAAAARLAGLDTTQTANALGLAAMFAAGLAESIRAGTGEYHYLKGLAGLHAHMAVELARTGAQSAPAAFEGNGGFYRMFTGIDPGALAEFDVAGDVLRRAATDWEIPELIYKPYPSNYFNMPFIDGAREIREAHELRPGEVTGVSLDIGDRAARSGGLLGPPFTHRGSTLASTQFGVAAMLARGRMGLAETMDRDAADILRICQMTSVHHEPGLATARITITTTTGTYHRDLEQDARDYRLPLVDVMKTFTGIVPGCLGERRAEKLLDDLLRIDELDSLAPTCALLAPEEA